MEVLTRHARLLYLLALFQLLGGPLVLGGVMMVTSLMKEREMTLSQSISQTLHHLEQGEVAGAGEWTWTEDHGLLPPVKPRPPQPPKTKDGKGKLWVVNDLESFPWQASMLLKIHMQGWHDPVPLRLAHAPPIPPPRAV